MNATRAQSARVYRSLPLWLAREYLMELGGRADDASINGEGWRAEICDAPDVVFGAIRIGQIEIRVDGDAESVARLIAAFEKKALRAGG